MFKVTVYTSTLQDTAEAVGELIAQSLAAHVTAPPQAAVLLNAGHDNDATLLTALHDTWPDIPVIGSATEVLLTGKRLSLVLLSSNSIRFHVGLGVHVASSPTHAAELALCDIVRNEAPAALYLTLPASLHEWNNSFAEAIRKLLPCGTPFLNELLPSTEFKSFTPNVKYYYGRKVLYDSVPVIVGCLHAVGDHSWRFTRQRGIVRKTCNEHVYIYDTLIGDRRSILHSPRVA